jgi:phosphatidylserine decarboxylase
VSEPGPGAGGRAFVALQHLLPQHGISRLVLAATRSLVHCIQERSDSACSCAAFKPDMVGRVETEPTAYASFNEFFTRALRPERPP